MTSATNLHAARSPRLDPGSFRDPAGGVVFLDARVVRYLIDAAGTDLLGLLERSWFQELVADGKVVRSSPLRLSEIPSVSELDSNISNITVVVEHPRIEFLSYPYEWPFEMLRVAAEQQLELTAKAFANGHMLKDATPYNIQFRGTRPIFVDVPSFEQYTAGEGWRAYSQFCRMFLNPLYLHAYGRIAFQPWLRSRLEGIDAGLTRRLLPLHSKVRMSVFIDVVLQSILEQRFANSESIVNAATKRIIPDNVVHSMIGRATKTVERLRRPKADSAWAAYDQTKSHYPPEAEAFKEAFVRGTLERARPRTVWDLGCNTGRFSFISARIAESVIAIDSDEPSIDMLYRRARESQPNILPLVMDLTNPSPNQGWAQGERRGFSERGTADVALCLALIHHVAISGNVPFSRFVDWLASLTRAAVIEFVPKSDVMVQRLLLTRKDVYHRYTPEAFEAAISRRFRIVERAELPNSERVLYWVKRERTL